MKKKMKHQQIYNHLMLIFITLEILCLLSGAVILFISCSIEFAASFNKNEYGDFDKDTGFIFLMICIGLAVGGFYLAWSFLVAIHMVRITLKMEDSDQTSVSGNKENIFSYAEQIDFGKSN